MAIELKTVATPPTSPSAISPAAAGRRSSSSTAPAASTADDPFLKALASKHCVYAPLLPGYGDSEECAELRDMLDVTLHNLDIVDALGLKDPILAGHSMGGMIAAEMAAIAPHVSRAWRSSRRRVCGSTIIRSPTCSRWCRTNTRRCCSTTPRRAPR